MALETEYRGHNIRYDGDRDEWIVEGLAYRSPKLSLCKARVDKFDLELRRLDNVRVLLVSSHNDAEATEATSIDADGKSLYVIKRVGNKTERGKTDMARAILDTPENRTILAEVKALKEQARELERKARGMVEAIPRVTADILRGKGAEYDL